MTAKVVNGLVVLMAVAAAAALAWWIAGDPLNATTEEAATPAPDLNLAPAVPTAAPTATPFVPIEIELIPGESVTAEELMDLAATRTPQEEGGGR